MSPDLLNLSEIEERAAGPKWYVQRAGAKFTDPVAYFVTAVPPEHDCWNGASLSFYADVGVWSDSGVTTKELAEQIASNHNDVPAMLAELRALRSALLRYGGHTKECAVFDGECICRWDTLKAKLEHAQ